jgi:hypothetical protein
MMRGITLHRSEGEMLRRPCSILIAVALALSPGLFAVAGESISPPLKSVAAPTPLKLVTRDGRVFQGQVVAWNRSRLVVEQEGGKRVELQWSDLFASTVFDTYRRTMDSRDPQQWLELGRLLRQLPGGGDHAESALTVAELLDGALADAAAEVRAMPDPPEDAIATAVAAPRPPTPAFEPGPLDAPTDKIGRAAAAADTYTWGDLNPLTHAIHIQNARDFADEVARTLGVRLAEVETEHFLYFTNVPPQQTFHSPRLLDQMYDKACELYGVPRGARLFKGKASVFMFANQQQLKAYTQHFGGPAWAAGFCQTLGDGSVRIVMYQNPDRGYTIHTMLHETAHGVNWRYRSPVPLPPWLEEGIAEWVAANTTGNFRYVRANRRVAADHVRNAWQLGDALFEPPGIQQQWEYGLAYAMVDHLIARDRRAFVELVDRIKDGEDWEDALHNTFRLRSNELLARIGQSIGVPELRR